MKRFRTISRVLVLLVPLLALIPIGRIGADWLQVSRMLEEPAPSNNTRGFDWVLWQDNEGAITARYVFSEGPAAEAGLKEGDVFYMLEHQQYFNAEDLTRVVEGIPPGSKRLFSVFRGGTPVEANVRIKQYPTFLYPLSSSLWSFSIWGFTLGAFVHLLGLVIAGPLALRSRKARSSLLLIAVSSLWMFATLLRLLAIEAVGPPDVGGLYNTTFQALTVVGMIGWIGFPALLLRKVLTDTRALGGAPLARWMYALLYLPPLLLGAAAVGASLLDGLGPLTLNSLVAPILFYVCCYIALAALLVLTLYLADPHRARELVGGWGRFGSSVTSGVALLAALSVLGVVPLFGAVTDTTAGWLVVGAQLLAVGPVVLVSLATLKYGKVSLVLSRALTYATVLGLIFFAFVGGMALLDPLMQHLAVSPRLVAGVYVVALLVIFERGARRLRRYLRTFFATERQRTRQALRRFQEQMRDILDLNALTRQTVHTVGEAFEARFAVLFLRPANREATWLSSSYHPQPPYFTERLFKRIWPQMQQERRIWARNPELNQTELPEHLSQLLEKRGAALAVPILGEETPIGLLVLGPKKQRRAVYNLEDLDLLRSLGSQLALAVERLTLVEREKALVRETAEAELVALRAQINPHFLFNALNTIAALVEERPGEAETVVEHLSALFRHILKTGSQPFVTLGEEFALVEHYLRIEQARFGPKLAVQKTLPPSLRDHTVPAFSVQTLVENAVKHGLAHQRGDGQVRIEAAPTGQDGVEVVVSDTGVGIPALFEQDAGAPADTSFFGIGLQNVDARLEQLYGRDDLLRFSSDPDEGTRVRLLLPADRSGAFSTSPQRPASPSHPETQRGEVPV